MGAAEEDNLLAEINKFRQSSGVAALQRHLKADCIADEVADSLEHQSCATPTSQSRLLDSYNGFALKTCHVDPNTMRDGVILPVCEHDRTQRMVLANYTQNVYLNDSKFRGVGIGMEDDWTVLVLITSSVGGNVASTAFRILLPAACTSMLLLAFM